MNKKKIKIMYAYQNKKIHLKLKMVKTVFKVQINLLRKIILILIKKNILVQIYRILIKQLKIQKKLKIIYLFNL